MFSLVVTGTNLRQNWRGEARKGGGGGGRILRNSHRKVTAKLDALPGNESHRVMGGSFATRGRGNRARPRLHKKDHNANASKR